MEVSATPLRILVLDDHPMARDAIRTALPFCQCAQPEIVGEAGDGATAIELARQLKPGVITVDIGLPDISGLEVIRRLKAGKPQVEIVVVTLEEGRQSREEAVEAGAISYITKKHLINELPGCLDRLEGQRSLHRAEGDQSECGRLAHDRDRDPQDGDYDNVSCH